MRVDFWCPKVFVQIVTYQIRFCQIRERPPFWLLWIDVFVVVLNEYVSSGLNRDLVDVE
jgi:hypothetical protein